MSLLLTGILCIVLGISSLRDSERKSKSDRSLTASAGMSTEFRSAARRGVGVIAIAAGIGAAALGLLTF